MCISMHFIYRCKNSKSGPTCGATTRQNDTILYVLVVIAAVLPILGVFILCCCVYSGRHEVKKTEIAKTDYGTG